MSEKISKTDAEWAAELTPDQFRVARGKGTEPAFTGEYCAHHDDGVYACVCCGAALFDSSTKYESGSGWPSFYAPLDPEQVTVQVDSSHGMVRQEILCSSCDAHLGHVFDDGPLPTGQRFCTNSLSLRFRTRD